MSTRISIDVQTGALLRAAQANQSAVRRGFVEGQARELAAAEAQAAKAADLEARGVQVVGSVGADGSVRIGQRAKPVPRVTPKPTANRRDDRAFVFVPQADFPPPLFDAAWRMRDGTPITMRNGDADYYDDPVLLPSGGPNGQPAYQMPLPFYGGFETSADNKFAPTDAVTIDGWVKFPNAAGDSGSPFLLYSWLRFGIVRAPIGDGLGSYFTTPAARPFFAVSAECRKAGGSSPTLIIAGSYVVLDPIPLQPENPNANRLFTSETTVFSTGSGATLEQMQAWHHYAVELTSSGLMTCYFNGAVIASVNHATAFPLSDARVFVGGDVEMSDPDPPSKIGTEVEASNVRYRPRLAYKGQPFTP